jgi:hypothetical protein
MYMNQPACVAPALAYGPDRTRGDSDADGGCSLDIRFDFFAGGADADSVAAVALVEGSGRFRLGTGGADSAVRLSFSAGAAAELRSSFALRAPRAPRFPDTASHLVTASAGPILAMPE